MAITAKQKPVSTAGFSLLELITALAVLATLASITSSALQNIFSELENDEVQSHLNALAAECLRMYANTADNAPQIGRPTSVNSRLIQDNNYTEEDNNSCTYFAIKPVKSTSKTHFSMGFGLAHGKITKFGIKNANESPDIVTRCERWAGKGNCLENGSDYSSFFRYMENVRRKRADCIVKLEKGMRENGNPANGGNLKTWDANGSKSCSRKTLPANANESSYKNGCNPNSCTMNVRIRNNRIVATHTDPIKADNLYDIYVTNEASLKSDLAIKLRNEKLDAIQSKIAECTINLEDIRDTKTGGPHIVGKGAAEGGGDLNGLPPCGQKVWVYDGVIYYEEQ